MAGTQVCARPTRRTTFHRRRAVPLWLEIGVLISLYLLMFKGDDMFACATALCAVFGELAFDLELSLKIPVRIARDRE